MPRIGPLGRRVERRLQRGRQRKTPRGIGLDCRFGRHETGAQLAHHLLRERRAISRVCRVERIERQLTFQIGIVVAAQAVLGDELVLRVVGQRHTRHHRSRRRAAQFGHGQAGPHGHRRKQNAGRQRDRRPSHSEPPKCGAAKITPEEGLRRSSERPPVGRLLSGMTRLPDAPGGRYDRSCRGGSGWPPRPSPGASWRRRPPCRWCRTT